MKFAFHPGVVLTVLLAGGWYGFAMTRGGEGFVDRQLLQENLKRFFGGSGHSHPVYYYLPYLFSLGLPWSLFFPFLLWDLVKKSRTGGDDHLFVKSWFVIMFVFFSLSAGKRPVYLLPLYPPLSLLLADWIYQQYQSTGWRLGLYRILAGIAAMSAVALLIISIGAVWSHEAGWFFGPIASFLKPKDRASLMVVQDALDSFGAGFTIVMVVAAVFWFALGRAFWHAQVPRAALLLLGISIVFGFISRGVVIPVIAADKSYREFVLAMDRQIAASSVIYLFGEFNSDPVVFYHRKTLEMLEQPLADVAPKIGTGNDYLIMPRQTWEKIAKLRPGLPPPILSSTGKGAEGDAPLVLVRAQFT